VLNSAPSHDIREGGYKAHTFLTWHKLDVSCQCEASAALPMTKESITHWWGNWEGPRASRDVMKGRNIIAPTGNQTFVIQPEFLLQYWATLGQMLANMQAIKWTACWYHKWPESFCCPKGSRCSLFKTQVDTAYSHVFTA